MYRPKFRPYSFATPAGLCAVVTADNALHDPIQLTLCPVLLAPAPDCLCNASGFPAVLPWSNDWDASFWLCLCLAL